MPLITSDNYELVKEFAAEWLGQVGYESHFRYFNAPMPNRLERLKNHLETVIALADNNTPVGYGHLDPGPDGRVWLGVAVLPKHHRHGLGIGICHYLLERAFLKNVDTIWLGVDESNIPARRLYRKLGFEVEEMQKEYWLMKKVFDNPASER